MLLHVDRLATRHVLRDESYLDTMNQARLHLLCGKMASGKSTLAARLSEEHGAIVISEDLMLARLYPGEIRDVASYVARAARIRESLRPQLVASLRLGLSIVLDFPANTREQRGSLVEIARDAGVDHVLHYIDCSDDTCKTRLVRRGIEQPERAATDTLEMFEAITRFFQPPSADEGLNVLRITG